MNGFALITCSNIKVCETVKNALRKYVYSLAYRFLSCSSCVSLLSLFWKHKRKLMRSLCSLCVCRCIPLTTSELLNQYLWNLVGATWAHLNGVLYKSLPSSVLCVCMCIPLSMLGNGSVKRYRGDEYTQEQKNCWTCRFLCGTCRIKWK
jgi:hypothetical protein